MRPFSRLLLLAWLIAPAAALAAPPSPLPSEVRLSDEEKEKVLEAAAAAANGQQHRPPAVADADADSAPPPIHGEVGFEIGTGGYRSAYGTAVIPMDDGVAIISLGTADFGKRRFVEPWWR